MENQQNMIQTALNAAQKPFIEIAPNGSPIIFTPREHGEWTFDELPNLQVRPTRKKGGFDFHSTESLIKFVQKHKQEGTQIFIDADYQNGKIDVTAVIDGHTAESADWGDFQAHFAPKYTVSAATWLRGNSEKHNQAEFAAFLTNRARDIVSRNPANEAAKYPTAAEVLDFALNLEYTEKTTFKQGYREQDGRINFTFQSEDAGKTETNLKAFERFGLSFTPFQGGDSYFVEALLKFRIDKNTGALVLWYELQQIDAVIEQATQEIETKLQEAFANIDIYYGKFLHR